jgi:flagellar protein export ATPase FliI
VTETTTVVAAADEGRPAVNLAPYRARLRQVTTLRSVGRVVQLIGLAIEAEGLRSRIGELCYIQGDRDETIAAEVVGFRGDRVLLMAMDAMHGIQPGSEIVATGRLFRVPVGPELLGRVLDGLGRPLDGLGPLRTTRTWPVSNDPPNPLARDRIKQPLETGVRAIDGLLTCGKGQRLGIFAGSGVGKSTLLGMIARNAASALSVIGLIGERGREVREFIERDLGPEGLGRSVIVVSTSDQPALLRLKGAWVATAIAEYFRDQGNDVTFMMDSVTRFAMAQREIGLAIGEPPASKGYTPSVFALLPRLMERAGTSDRGSITGFYTVLVEGDDLNEPVTDTARGILDGHIVLSRALAAENHYPAIDVLNSVSRVMPEVTSRAHRDAAGRLREILATYNNARDLINIGAYAAGSNPRIDRAIQLHGPTISFLRQPPHERASFSETISQLTTLFPAPRGGE